MELLIAVTTCRARAHQSDVQRRTWAKDRRDTVFFVGGDEPTEHCYEVALGCDDSYQGLPAKVRGVARFALVHGYNAVLKVDDDVYLAPERIAEGLRTWQEYDYAGNFRMHNGNYPADYASGFCYFLGKRGLEIIANTELTEDTMEDRWVGNALSGQRPLVKMYDEKRFCCTYPAGIDEAKFLWGSPIGKTNIAFAQYPAHKFEDLHHWYTLVYQGAHSAHA